MGGSVCGLDSSVPGLRPVAGSCGEVNELSSATKGGDIRD